MKKITGIALLSLLFVALPAAAECGRLPGHNSANLMQQSVWSAQANLLPASLTLVSSQSEVEPIVGFWQSTLTSGELTIDSGYVQWHSDGTEIMNSSRDPRTQSFCLGVWKKVSTGTYKLNHIAMSWDGNGVFIGPANIRQTVHVSRAANSYSGTFSLDQYDTSGNVLVHFDGTVAATRVTVDTPPKF